MKKKILIVTTSRAEFGLLSRIIMKFNNDSAFSTKLIVSGAHLKKKLGLTINEIKSIIKKNILSLNFKYLKSNPLNNSKFISALILNFSKVVEKFKPNFILLFGDRFEILSFAYIANIMRVNVLHIGGGEKTSGSIDDNYRNSISKLSNYHFVTHRHHKTRLMQMGEDSKKIFIVGSPGIEVIKKTKFIKKRQIEKLLKFKFIKKNTILVSFYPEANDPYQDKKNINNLIDALKNFNDYNIIFTLPNLDNNSDMIKKKINDFSKQKKNVRVFHSLGSKLFLSLLRNVEVFLGNSSSGLIEAPILNTKVINIGDRQKGRITPPGIYHSKCLTKNIINCINKVLKSKKNSFRNIYPNLKTSDILIKKVKNLDMNYFTKNFIDRKFI